MSNKHNLLYKTCSDRPRRRRKMKKIAKKIETRMFIKN
jgi:hypothetical protein